MENIIGAFENLIDSWSDLWTGLPRFFDLFSWLPSDIVAAIAVLITILLVLACWRIFN